MGAAINSTWHDDQNGGSPWNWSSWYDGIVRPSFCHSEESVYSSLCIDNYEDSLYMQTVQGYVQGLEEGSIRQNCTFIDIRATATTWNSGEQILERRVTYKAPNGKYYTIVTKITGAICGTGTKDIEVDVYKPTTQPLDINGDKWLSVTLTIPSIITYFAWAADAHTILAVFSDVDLTQAKLQIAYVHNDVYGMVKAVGVPVAKILAIWAPLPALSLFCLQVGLAAFIAGDLAYAISAAAGLPGWACLGNAIGGAFIGAAISLLTTNIGGLAAAVLGIASVATLAACLIGIGVVIILVVVIWWWVTA
jgi:hypothetical protein